MHQFEARDLEGSKAPDGEECESKNQQKCHYKH